MQCKVMVSIVILSLGILLTFIPLLSQSPYPSVAPGQRVRVNGVLINRGEGVTMNLTANDMERLTYGVDEIPGYTVIPSPHSGNHTVIYLDSGKLSEGLKSSILRIWSDIVQARQFQQGLIEFPRLYDQQINIEVRVYDRPAELYGETLSNYRWQSSAGWKIQEGTPSGFPLGEESWYFPPRIQHFRANRCSAIIDAPDLALAEALAIGIEYRIQQHPKRLGIAKQPMTVLVANQPVASGKAIPLAGVTVAPLSTLPSAKVILQTNRTKKEWIVTASLNGRWVKVRAFSWEMETEKGKVKLERPVFPYKGDLIVPLRQVAEALGIKVHQKGQTIALLPN